jgi:tagatose 1,6-diphosphate aldolase
LIFYHPEAGHSTQQQDDLVRVVANACNQTEIPFFLEPMFYSTHGTTVIDSPAFAELRTSVVVESVRRLSGLGAHIMKVPFPVDARRETSDRVWRQACERLNDVCHVPWALLSGGDRFESFKAQLHVACESGCSGFMAGRALWADAVGAPPRERPGILLNTVLPRFRELSDIVKRYGHCWSEKYAVPTINDGWYRRY